MTPTEQDKDLREKLRVMIRGYLLHYTDSARDSLVYADEVLSLITQYGDTRERLGRIDELLHLVDESSDTNWKSNAWFSVRDRMAEIKAQQEEV